MRRLAIVVFALLAACSPPGQQRSDTPAGHAAPNDEQADALAAALTPALSEAIGRPVSLEVQTSTMDGTWGWIVAQPWTPEGAQIDWSQTRYAERAQEGLLDGNGLTYALLQQRNGDWRVVEFAVGPTDAPWLDWAERHGAPASMMQTPD